MEIVDVKFYFETLGNVREASFRFSLKNKHFGLRAYFNRSDQIWRIVSFSHQDELGICPLCGKEISLGMSCSDLLFKKNELLGSLVRHKDVRIKCVLRMKPIVFE